MNKWIKSLEKVEGEKDDTKLTQVLLDESTDTLREALGYIEHAGHVELTELMASVVGMLASASQRKRDPALKRKVVKRVRALIELMLEDENIRETDPADMSRAIAACEKVFFQAGMYKLRLMLKHNKGERVHEENAEQHQADLEEQERVRAEMAKKAPMDGVEQDIQE